MKTLALGAAFAGVWIGAATGQPDVAPAVEPPPFHEASPTTSSVPPATLTEVVQQYCVTCHNDALMTGNVSFQHFSVEEADENAETAERMIRKLRAGMMPPPGMPRPSVDTLSALVETLEDQVDQAAATTLNLGERRFQRLSRAEYERVIGDLLAIDVEAGDWLPPDVILESFDNMADAQALSTTLVDSYLRAATEVSRLAVGNPNAVSTTRKYQNPIELSQHAWDHIEGTPFGTRGGMVVKHSFPADGEYVFEFNTLFGEGTRMFPEVDVSIDGEPVARIQLEYNAETTVPSIKTEPIFVAAGQRQVSVAFVRKIGGPYDDRFSPPEWSFVGGEDSRSWANYGITALPHLNEVMITGPRNVTGVSATASRDQVFTCHPSSGAEARPCAESILRRLATSAYRRPVSDQDVAELMAFYDEVAPQEGFEIGVRMGLQAILAAPEFVFRLERMPADARPGEGYRLSDVDLATRLSFFLWASSPDEELMDVADAGRLSDPAVLEQQVRRMLDDPRAEALATRFAHQWLRLQDVGKVWPEPFLYPDFSEQLANAMVRETELLFDYLVEEDRSLLELFNADYTFVNERLARHYGIEGVSGNDFRKVEYPMSTRRGILGHGSVLLLTSMSARTSPVIRGKYVMEVLMGTPPPPPPPNVPTLDETDGSGESDDGGVKRRLTTRERMEKHRANPVCESCHRFMDPIGLALDNFDVTGKWRIRENMVALDTRGTFYDGTAISQPNHLVDVLMKRPVPLVRNFTQHLLAYAIGRPTEYFDQPTVRAIAERAAGNDYAMTSFVLGVVQSDPFQMRQTQTTADD